MKKIIVLMTMMVMFLALSLQSVGAEKVQWKDENYNFESVKVIAIQDIDIKEPSYENFVFDNAAKDKVEVSLKQALNDRHIRALHTDVKDQTVAELQANKNMPRLTVNVYALGSEWVWREPWTEKRPVTRKISVLNDEGKYTTVSYPDIEIIHHPGRKFWTARVELEFVLIDPKTDQAIYTSHDMRVLEGTTNTTDMLKRATRGFARDISHNG